MKFNSYQVHGLGNGEKPVPGSSPRGKSISVDPDLLPHIRVSTWEGMVQLGKTPVVTQN